MQPNHYDHNELFLWLKPLEIQAFSMIHPHQYTREKELSSFFVNLPGSVPMGNLVIKDK